MQAQVGQCALQELPADSRSPQRGVWSKWLEPEPALIDRMGPSLRAAIDFKTHMVSFGNTTSAGHFPMPTQS
jgi:hypothetical protein